MVKELIKQPRAAWRSDGQMKRKRFCKCCRRQKYGVSNKGLCVPCAIGKVKKATIQMIDKKGHIYKKYVRSMKRAVKEM